MAGLLLIIATSCLMGFVSASPASYPAYFYPIRTIPMEHRSSLVALRETFPDDGYDYTIVPLDQYTNNAVADYQPISDLSLWDCIPNLITAITTIGSTTLSMALYLLPQVIWVAVGAMLLVGFCAFTPYCTLILQNPYSHDLRLLGTSCLDYAEDLFTAAYEKFNEI